MIKKSLLTAILSFPLLISSASAADQINFQFGWLPGGDRGYFYIAQEQGLFAAEDLDVNLLPGKGSSDAISKIASGVAQMGEGGLDALLTAKVQGEIPVTGVMPMFTKVPDGLATTTDSGIETLADLKGKKVATSPFTSSNGPWPFLLEMNTVDPTAVNTTNADAATLPALLATGQVDAIISYVTNTPATSVVLEQAGKKLKVIPWSDYGLDGYSTTIFVNDTYLAEHRDVVVRFLRAIKKAAVMMQEDPALAAASLKAAVPEVDEKISEEVVVATIPLMFNDVTDKAGLGIFDPERVTTTWSWVAKQKSVALDSMDPMSAIDMTFASEM